MPGSFLISKPETVGTDDRTTEDMATFTHNDIVGQGYPWTQYSLLANLTPGSNNTAGAHDNVFAHDSLSLNNSLRADAGRIRDPRGRRHNGRRVNTRLWNWRRVKPMAQASIAEVGVIQ